MQRIFADHFPDLLQDSKLNSRTRHGQNRADDRCVYLL